MTAHFADTFYYLALMNAADRHHETTCEYAAKSRDPIVTTAWVLVELADALSAPARRPQFAALMDALRESNTVTVVQPDQEFFDAGVRLFNERTDKGWSLTDCISLVVMKRESIQMVPDRGQAFHPGRI